MKHLKTIVAAALISGGLAGTAYAVQAKDSADNDAKSAAEATITLNSALEIALQSVPGTAVGVEFENEDGIALWEVEILASNQQVYDLEIDAISGEVLKNKIDKDDREEDDD